MIFIVLLYKYVRKFFLTVKPKGRPILDIKASWKEGVAVPPALEVTVLAKAKWACGGNGGGLT